MYNFTSWIWRESTACIHHRNLYSFTAWLGVKVLHVNYTIGFRSSILQTEAIVVHARHDWFHHLLHIPGKSDRVVQTRYTIDVICSWSVLRTKVIELCTRGTCCVFLIDATWRSYSEVLRVLK